MAEWERDYYGGADPAKAGTKSPSLVEALDAVDDDHDEFDALPDPPPSATPPKSAPKRSAPAFRMPSGTALYVIVSVLFALIFGTYSGLFQRAFGDPEVHGIWVSIGSVLFVLWVIGVTTYAVLRISFVVSSIVLRATARFSILAFDILRTPLKIATYIAVAALAVFGAYALYVRLSLGAG